MIGCVCKYTPIEILESFGEEVYRIEPSILNFDKADSLMHVNMCTYAKAVLETAFQNKVESLVLVNCCDSIRRLYDVLKIQNKFKFLYIIDLPRKNTTYSEKIFLEEIKKFIISYENFSDKKFNEETLRKLLNEKEVAANTNSSKDLNLVVMGARCRKSTIDLIRNCGGEVNYNLTCTGRNINFRGTGPSESVLNYYIKDLLNSQPCMRMINTENRLKFIEDNEKNINGIIYHTVKFCDYYNFEYSKLKNETSIPLLKIETDYTEQCEGQMKTRIEAFIESLKGKKIKSLEVKNPDNLSKNSIKAHNKFILGIDSGSTSTNAVILDENKNIIAFSVVRTGAKSINSAYTALEEVLNKANLSKEDLVSIVATGYGRVSIPFATKNITEITCHGKGSFHLNKDIRTIIDIGGQDSKIIRLNENGEIVDFSMNDKCAAGTGRFLEMMAKTLEIPLSELGPEALKWKESICITNMCTVFAESEVISLIAENKEKADIIHGLNNSIAGKTVSMLDRVGRKGAYMMSGGVAQNIGVVRALEDKLQEKIFIPEYPEIVGALGAALIGLEELNTK